MKKLMDLYTSHIEQFMGRKENLKTTSRVILANNGRFEGITTDIENKPVSFIFGRSFPVFCDTISRVIIAPAELPVSVVTSLIGAPFFIFLILKTNKL